MWQGELIAWAKLMCVVGSVNVVSCRSLGEHRIRLYAKYIRAILNVTRVIEMKRQEEVGEHSNRPQKKKNIYETKKTCSKN